MISRWPHDITGPVHGMVLKATRGTSAPVVSLHGAPRYRSNDLNPTAEANVTLRMGNEAYGAVVGFWDSLAGDWFAMRLPLQPGYDWYAVHPLADYTARVAAFGLYEVSIDLEVAADAPVA